jgi:hypothetical protein
MAAGTLNARKLSDLREGDWSGDGDDGRGAKDRYTTHIDTRIDRQGEGIWQRPIGEAVEE